MSRNPNANVDKNIECRIKPFIIRRFSVRVSTFSLLAQLQRAALRVFRIPVIRQVSPKRLTWTSFTECLIHPAVLPQRMGLPALRRSLGALKYKTFVHSFSRIMAPECPHLRRTDVMDSWPNISINAPRHSTLFLRAHEQRDIFSSNLLSRRPRDVFLTAMRVSEPLA